MRTLNTVIGATLLLFSVTAATAGAIENAASAGTAEPAFKCNPNGNQAELSQCAADDYAASDKKLNDTWQALMSIHKHEEKIPAQLKKAQKAWVAFRDAEVEAQFACDGGNCWGSMEGMVRSGVLKELTDTRTARLQKYIDDGLGVKMGN
jgi:uncharacterized protein YecT (DUF1311 family)